MKALEESGKVRRGYFAADLGATQFAMPAAVDLLRSLRGAARWRQERDADARRDRPGKPLWHAAEVAGGRGYIIFVDAQRWGARHSVRRGVDRLPAARGIRTCSSFCRKRSRRVAKPQRRWRSSWVERAHLEGGMLVTSVNGVAVAEHWMARTWLEAGFVAGAMGFNLRRVLPALPGTATSRA